MARLFNGTSSDYITYGSEAAIDNLTQYTAIAWIYPTAAITGEMQILTKMNSSFLGKMYLTLFSGGGGGNNQILTLASKTTTAALARSDTTFSPNVWTMIMSKWDGTNPPKLYTCLLGTAPVEVSSYLDSTSGSGTLIDDGSATLRYATRDTLETFYSGAGADWGLWNRVLTAQEDVMLGQGYSPEFVPSGLVGSCRMCGTINPEINFGGSVNGTVLGTTLFTHPKIVYPNDLYINSSIRPRRTAPGICR
jgi:hypothetical protein